MKHTLSPSAYLHATVHTQGHAACRGAEGRGSGPGGPSRTEQEMPALGRGQPVPLGERGRLSTDVEKPGEGRAPGWADTGALIGRGWVWGNCLGACLLTSRALTAVCFPQIAR